jgi:hypothetical protein
VRVLVCQKDVKVEKGALRVMEPYLERVELKVMRQVGGSGTQLSRGRRNGGSILVAPLDVCALIETHPQESE